MRNCCAEIGKTEFINYTSYVKDLNSTWTQYKRFNLSELLIIESS